MHRRLALALVVLAAASAGAQEDRFIAPSNNSISASPEVSPGPEQRTLFFVENHSTVPIIVYGFTLTSCENVKQWCGGQRVNVPVPPGGRRIIGRVEAKSTEQSMSYRWSYAWRADSSDAKMLEVMRRNGFGGVEPPASPTVPTPPAEPVVAEAPPAAPAAPTANVEVGAVRAVSDAGASMRPLVASTEIAGIAQATSAIAPTRQFFVTNGSKYAVVVYSFNLDTCVNVKQVCGRTPTDVHLRPGARAQVGRVDAQDRRARYTYNWTYDWRLDTTDVATAAAMRARGLREGTLGHAQNLATQAASEPGGIPTRSVRENFRFRVARGSILASTQAKDGLVLATGACIDPAELAAIERDSTIAGSPAVPAKLRPNSLSLPMMPAELVTSLPADARVFVRWVVDTDGSTLPGSASVVESPSGALSVKMCGTVLGARLEPARDAEGHPVRSWVQAPLRVNR